MVLHGYKVNKAKLANGTEVAVNDHVYYTVPWSERDGTPYHVARIIEFLPPLTTPKKGSKQSRSSDVQVRLSIFYRLSDLSLRPSTDNRLLMAAIHTDTQPLSAVRGKCYVRHKDRIEDLTTWKKKPDHFYFVRYYDPFIKRDYELLRTETVNNIPAHVKEVLMSRYEYLITEKEMVADLTDVYRSCCVCDQWAASQESVRCESCRKDYHMACLKPPLLAKPAKGYSWVCIPCSVQRNQDVQDLKFYHQSNGQPTKSKTNGKASKDKSAIAASSHRPDTTFRGWSWRYFGLYTTAEDTLDPDDLIFPRAATRVGPRFQANVPTWEEQKAAEQAKLHGEGESGPSRHIAVERGYDVGQKKHESTISVICTPSDDLNTYMAQVASMKLPVPPYDVRRLDRAAISYTEKGPEAALRTMQSLSLAEYNPIIFTESETSIFETNLDLYGGLDTHSTAKALGKRPAEVLRYFYIWKNRQLEAENRALRQHHKISTVHSRSTKTLGAPSVGKTREREQSADSDDEGSLYSPSSAVSIRKKCAGCHTKISDNWWRAPRGFSGDVMCETCGTDYRKYGIRTFNRADDSKRLDRKDGPPLKKHKGVASGTSTPVPAPPPKLPPCACCQRMEPKSMMARCKNCTYSVHAGCYGIASQDLGPDWECELCVNLKLQECHLEPRCVLCPRQSPVLNSDARAAKRKADFDLLSALKPTEGRRWAHVLCSAWSPEVQFTDAATFKSVEGISSVPRTEEGCTICEGIDGTVLHCAIPGCSTCFHPACAWASSYRFGFEFSLAKPGRREVVTIAKFKEETGVMTASIWCKKHDPTSSVEVKEARDNRPVYDMHEIDPELNETALQVYISSYKTLSPHESFALLRKAKRLDALLPQIPTTNITKQCHQCEVDVSPAWTKMDFNGQPGWLCHLCTYYRPE